MTKIVLTFAAFFGFVAGAFAQGTLTIGNAEQADFAGFNTASSDPWDTSGSDWADGMITLEIFSIAAAGNASLVSTINNDAANASTEEAAVALVEGNFKQQAFGTSMGSETMSQTFSISVGDFSSDPGPTESIGNSVTLPSGSSIYYAIVATYEDMEGVLVLNQQAGYGAGGGTYSTPQMYEIWPNQNLFLAPVTPVPEPATLALAGLGGFTAFFLRRRNS